MDYNNNGGSDHSSESRREYGSNESRPYRERSNSGNGERRHFTTSRNHRPYGEGKPAYSSSHGGAEKVDFSNYSSERKPYGGHSEGGERHSYSDRKPSFGGRKSYGDRQNGGSYGEKRSYGDRSERSFSDRKQYGERKNYGDRKPYYNSNEGDEAPRRSYQSGEGDAQQRRPRTSFNGEGRNFSGEGNSYGERRNNFSDRKPGFKKGAPKGGKKGPAAKGGNKFPKKPIFKAEDESGISRMIDRRREFENERLSDNDNVTFPMKEEVRLNKFIANSGICSRREADNFILAGCVTVNGNVVTELGSKINITSDDVRFNGERLHGEAKVYIVMNKPKGFVTTTSDPHAEKTVMELLKKCTARVFPVGRLDKNTTGVLMFTNDGEIAERLTHPAYDKKKIYQVSLDKDLTKEDYDKILAGVTLSDGDVCADALDYIEDDDKRKVGIEIHSGKNRIVRRIFESLGYDVKALDRVYFAGLTKKGLKRGEWRYLTEGEVNILKMGAYI